MKKKEIHRVVEKDGGGAQLENSDYFVSLKQDLNPRPSNLKDDISLFSFHFQITFTFMILWTNL